MIKINKGPEIRRSVIKAAYQKSVLIEILYEKQTVSLVVAMIRVRYGLPHF